MRSFVFTAFSLLFVLLFNGCQSSKSTNSDLGKFEYIRTEPGNELGIYTKIITQVFRPANQTVEEHRINREYLEDDVLEGLMSMCEKGAAGFRGCVSDDEGLSYRVGWGIPEPKNKTITYLEFEFRPFTKQVENGKPEVCILEEIYKLKAYVVLHTYSEVPSNDTFPRNVIDSVANVHQHQLDEFGENFLDLFGNKIDKKAIFNFGPDEYYDRDPPYECLLSIASSESKSVIETKCDFFCSSEIQNNISTEELEKVLMIAKAEAIALEESLEAEEGNAKDDLSHKNRVEL